MCTINGNHLMYGFWNKESDRNNFLSFWNIFNPFTLLWRYNIKISKNWKKKTTGDIIILQMCTINDNMMYGSWDMEFNNQTFLSFWTVFCLFTQNGPRKSNFWKNEKKHLEILSFYKCEPWMIIIWCMVSEIRSTTDRIFCHFRLFFCPFIPLTPPKIKILKK